MMRNVAAVVRALQGQRTSVDSDLSISSRGGHRYMLAEQLLHELACVSESDEYMVAAVLATLGDKEARRIGAMALERFTGVPVEDRRDTGREHVDVLILTVKPVELDAACRAFGQVLAHAEIHRAWKSSTLVTYPIEYRGLKIAVCMAGIDGNIHSALKMAYAFREYASKLTVLVGMAAGVSNEKTNLGDVVVASQVWAVDYVKVKRGSVVPRYKTYKPRDRLLESVELMQRVDSTWSSRIRAEIVNAGEKCWHDDDEPRLKIMTGVVFAGSRVIEDGSLGEGQLFVHDELRAGEMEGAGFAAAAEQEERDWLVVRGIADFGDIDAGLDGREGQRPKNWQYAATYAAARWLREALDRRDVVLKADFTSPRY